jgi:hypothetical protein
MPKVTLKAIGCGGAFSEDGYLFHSCIMITVNGKNLLFDFGKDVWPWAMKAQGLTANDVDGVIISHEHHDHLGALGMLGLKRFDFINKPKHHTEYKPPFKAPILYLAEGLKDGVWDFLKSNLLTNEGFIGNINTFFDTRIITEDNDFKFEFEGIKLQLVAQMHVMIGSHFMPTYGLYIDLGKDKIFITGDTQYFMPRQIKWFFDNSTMIIADCETFGTNLQFQEGTLVYKKDNKYYAWPTKVDDPEGMKALELSAEGYIPEKWKCLKGMSNVHATYPEWAGYDSANATVLPDSTKSIVNLYHYGDHIPKGLDGFGNKVDWDAQAKKDGLAGFIKPGQVFEFMTTY